MKVRLVKITYSFTEIDKDEVTHFLLQTLSKMRLANSYSFTEIGKIRLVNRFFVKKIVKNYVGENEVGKILTHLLKLAKTR